MQVNDPETGIFMITTQGNIEYICQPDVEIFGDGTFKYCPIYFYQLYAKTGVNQVNAIRTFFDILLRLQGTLDITFS